MQLYRKLQKGFTCFLAMAALATAIAPNISTAQNCTPPASGLVSWWPGEGNANDASDRNPGILEGSVGFATGKAGQAFAFNGSNANVKIFASPTLDVGRSNGFSIECWIKPDDISTQRPLLEWNDNSGADRGTHFWIAVTYLGGGPGSLYANIVDTNGVAHTIVTPPGVVNTNSFQHVAVTYNKSNGIANLYYNGTVAISQNLGIFTPQTSYNLYVGKRTAGSAAGTLYKGTIDEISLYSRALSDAEIQSIYNAGSAGKCLYLPAINRLQFFSNQRVRSSLQAPMSRSMSLPPEQPRYAINGDSTARTSQELPPVV